MDVHVSHKLACQATTQSKSKEKQKVLLTDNYFQTLSKKKSSGQVVLWKTYTEYFVALAMLGIDL